MSEQTRMLVERFMRLEALMHRYGARQRQKGDPASNPHRGQGRVLALLKMQPQMNQRDLAYVLGLRGQSLGELLAKLERSGYVTRTPSETDKRAMIVSLTPEGEAAAEEASQGRKVDSPIFDCLTPEEQATLAEYLDRLIDALEAETDDGPAPQHYEHMHGRGRGGYGFYGEDGPWGRGHGREMPCHPGMRRPGFDGGRPPMRPEGFGETGPTEEFDD